MMKTTELEFHEVANIFPLMDLGEVFEEFMADIEANGLREPIWLYEGKIIDGRNRYNACMAVGVEPVYKTWVGNEVDLVPFVVSLNLHRRHLDESQRGMVGARLANMREGRPKKTASIEAVFTQDEAADLLNTSRGSIQRATKVLSQGTPELQAKVDAGEVAVSTAAEIATLPLGEQTELVARGEVEIIKKAKEIRQAKTEKRRSERLEKIIEIADSSLPLEGKKYPLILADPPWSYEHCSTDNREIENHYPTMPLNEICDLPVTDKAMDDCILFLWATSPKLEESLQVINAWGFKYTTNFVWVKDKIGMGYYGRQQHELLLIAKRGAIPVPSPENRPSSVVHANRLDHSQKPECFYEIIEKMYPTLPKIELFARNGREGWDRWGNQA